MKFIIFEKALGQEGKRHKYIKREVLGSGKYRYWYKLPSGKVVSTKVRSYLRGLSLGFKDPSPKGEAFKTEQKTSDISSWKETLKKYGYKVSSSKENEVEFTNPKKDVLKVRKDGSWVTRGGRGNGPKELVTFLSRGEKTKDTKKVEVEGNKGDEPVIIYANKVVSEGSGHAKEHFKKQYGFEAKVGVEVKQPKKQDFKVKDEPTEMTEEEKEEAKAKHPHDPERAERMRKLKEEVLSKDPEESGNVNAPKGFSVGKYVEIGNSRLKIIATGPKGFSGRDQEGNVRRVRWAAVAGYD